MRQDISNSGSAFASLAFPLLVALYLFPVWYFQYFPSQDGPSHVYNSWILSKWGEPAGGIFRQYYAVNRRPEPNWASHIALAGLMRAGLSPSVAEKIFVSFLIVFFGGGVVLALGAVAKPARALAPVALPMAVGWPLGMGFYNYCLGVAGFLWVFAWWYPRRNGMTAPRAIALGSMGILLYFAHLVAVGGIVIVIGIVAFWESLAERPFGPALRKRLLPAALAFIPAVALGLAYVAASVARGQMREIPAMGAGLREIGRLLTLQNLMVCYSTAEVFPAALLAISMLASAGLALAQIRRDRAGLRSGGGLLVAAIGLLLLYCVAPDKVAGGTYFHQRLAPFIWLMLLLWLGADGLRGRRLAHWLRVSGIAVALAFGCMRIAQFARLNDYLAEYVSVGGAIQAPATVLPLCFSPRGEGRSGFVLSAEIAPFSHASGYLAAGRPIVDLSDYEGAMKYFPLVWRPELSPCYHICPDIFDDPFHADLLDYTNRTGGRGRIDYVLVWSNPDFPLPADLVDPVRRQLEAGFKPVMTSRPRGCARLYARVR
ncbi:MAG: hypothetical protein ABFD69_02705 [Candidatus Sumerlaeia bacterium]